MLTDISGQKAIQKRNAEFVSAVSHEMKTPLSGIKAYVELLVDGEAEDDATREEFLGVINSQADRLQRLIDNLLNLARIEAGVVAVNKRPQSLNELLEEAVDVHAAGGRAEADRARQRAQPAVSGRAGRPRHAAAGGDQPALQRREVHASAAARVTLRSRLNDQEVVFEVEDTGVGLSPEDCQQGVREVLSREEGPRDGAGHRPGPAAGQAHRRGRARRPHRSRQRAGPRQHVPRHPARHWRQAELP